jgi:hypothetical protein
VTEKRANARIRFLVLAFVAVFAVARPGRGVQVVEDRYERSTRQHRETIEIPPAGDDLRPDWRAARDRRAATTVYADPRNVSRR